MDILAKGLPYVERLLNNMDSKSKPFAHQDWSEDFFMPKKSTAKTTEKRMADAMKRGDHVVTIKKGNRALIPSHRQ